MTDTCRSFSKTGREFLVVLVVHDVGGGKPASLCGADGSGGPCDAREHHCCLWC